jgi:hypothetical protein
MLADGKRGKQGEGGIHSPLHSCSGILSGIPYAGWWRMREEKGRRTVPLGREIDKFQDL